jgi:hypothetical protein
MTSHLNQAGARTPILHPTPHLYLAVNYEPRPGIANWVNVLCELTDEGKAISAYLSPLDAMIDAACFSGPGRIYHAICAHEFDPGTFIGDHEGCLAFAVHLAWAAHSGKLIRRPNMAFAACRPAQAMQIQPTGMSRIEFNVARDILETYERIREQAGLFAHLETSRQIVDLSERRKHQIVAQAIQTIPGACDSDTGCNQLAIYDPDFTQWHFVPRSVLGDLDG